MRHRRTLLPAAVAVAAIAVLAAGLARAGAPTSAAAGDQQAGDPIAGAEVWASSGCGNCHILGGSGGEIGPSLDETKPSFDRVVEMVTNGGEIMPPYGGTLSTTEVQDVAAYVVEQSGGGVPSPSPEDAQPPPEDAQPPAEDPQPPPEDAQPPPSEGDPQPEETIVDVVLGSSKVVSQVERVGAGEVTFVVRNEATRESWFAVLSPDQPRPLLGKLPFLAPGETGRLTLTLSEGTKVLACCARSRDLEAQMFTVLRVKSAPPPESETGGATAPGSLRKGLKLFVSYCAGCHTFEAAGTSGTIGPNLDELQPSFEAVIAAVTEGKGGMPAFGNLLTSEQIERIAEFVSGSGER